MKTVSMNTFKSSLLTLVLGSGMLVLAIAQEQVPPSSSPQAPEAEPANSGEGPEQPAPPAAVPPPPAAVQPAAVPSSAPPSSGLNTVAGAVRPPAPPTLPALPQSSPGFHQRLAQIVNRAAIGSFQGDRTLIIRSCGSTEEQARTSSRRYSLDPVLAARYGLNARYGSTNTAQGTDPIPEFNAPQMREDLSIMARILEKEVEKQAGSALAERAMGISLSPVRERGPQEIYVEDFGAIFLLNVPFPLSGTAPETAPSKPVDPESPWEQTRRELYSNADPGPGMMMGERGTGVVMGGGMMMGGYGGGMGGMSGMGGGGFGGAIGGGGAVSNVYDSQQVERLKSALANCLTNAAHIRQMPPNERVVLVVQGSQTARPQPGPEHIGRGPEAAATCMVLQASKGDLNQQAEGKLGAQEFASRVKTLVY